MYTGYPYILDYLPIFMYTEYPYVLEYILIFWYIDYPGVLEFILILLNTNYPYILELDGVNSDTECSVKCFRGKHLLTVNFKG